MKNQTFVIGDTGAIEPIELANLIWLHCPGVRDVVVDSAGVVAFDCFDNQASVAMAFNYFQGSGLTISAR